LSNFTTSSPIRDARQRRGNDYYKHLNGKLKGRKSINSYDVLAVRRLYGIAGDEKPEFGIRPQVWGTAVQRGLY